MSRYLILVLLNLPLVVSSIISAVVAFKLSKISKRKFIFRISIWLCILVGLLSAESIYNFLFSNNLTQTEPLSLFDVIQITGILFTLFLANRSYIKADSLERKVQDLHQEIAIRMSEKQ